MFTSVQIEADSILNSRNIFSVSGKPSKSAVVCYTTMLKIILLLDSHVSYCKMLLSEITRPCSAPVTVFNNLAGNLTKSIKIVSLTELEEMLKPDLVKI